MFKFIKIILFVLNISNFKCAKSFTKPYIFNANNLHFRSNTNIMALKRYNNSISKDNLKLQKYHDTTNYLNTLNIKKNNITLIDNNISSGKKYTDQYLNELNHKYKLKIENNKISNRNIIHKINIDDLIMFNNFIDAIYYNSLNIKTDNIIIEFKNNTRKVFYYDNINLNITKIIDINQNIDLININDYPYYILNTPFAILICEQK
tara:strand:+ start:176 stop:793 length:618 start_codon:yes stop_codon:yes gene_type:complete